MDKIQALQSFWNSFDMNSYDKNSVPDDASLPYILHNFSVSDFDHPVSHTVDVCYKSQSWREATLKVEEISNRITRGGLMIGYDGGAIWINKGSPWAQRVADEDKGIRRIMLSVEVEFLD